MVENLKKLIKNSYSPISHYGVACILVCKNGQEFLGVNIENPSGKAGMCAEQSAISAAITEGYTSKDFKELHVMGTGKEICTPCFLCRQLLVEFFDASCDVICYNKKGNSKTYKVEELCPHAFKLEESEGKWIRKIIK